MDNIDIHADDYALTPNTSRDMLACMEKGLLDSISIVPNMSCFEECMELLYQKIPELPFLPKMSVHLDFVEGRCLAGKEKAPVLVGREETVMGLSWGKLFLLSYMPWKKRTVKTQLKLEIREQLKEVNAVIDRAVETAKEAGRSLKVVAYVCGTDKDRQNLEEQRTILAGEGAILADSNVEAAHLAAQLLGNQKGGKNR